ERAALGKTPLRYSPPLERAAAGHSRDMVRGNFMSHLSPVAGKRTPNDRIAKEGLSTRNGVTGENLSIVFGIEYESGKKIFPPREGRPRFSYEPFGKPIQNHTYAGLAKAALNGWMHSRRHRENILDVRFQYLGAGSAHYRDASFFNIDTFKLTQNFFGELGTKKNQRASPGPAPGAR
ncbi:MAG: CAP domain-containing protein, partial [Endomicrobiales bacterium]